MEQNEARGEQRLAVPVGPDDHARGSEDAPATVVVYGDYQCPDTRRSLLSIGNLEQRIGDRFRLVFRHFPLRKSHPHADGAAMLAEAAADQNKFWEVHQHLFDNQDALSPEQLNDYAEQFGIPSADEEGWHFRAGHRYADRVQEHVEGGLRSGVNETPTIFINGRRHQGGYDEGTLERAIDLAR